MDEEERGGTSFLFPFIGFQLIRPDQRHLNKEWTNYEGWIIESDIQITRGPRAHNTKHLTKAVFTHEQWPVSGELACPQVPCLTCSTQQSIVCFICVLTTENWFRDNANARMYSTVTCVLCYSFQQRGSPIKAQSCLETNFFSFNLSPLHILF